MGTKLRISRIVRYLPHVVAATLIVAVGPVAAIWILRRQGVIESPVVAIVLGAALAFGMSYLGAMLWKSRRASGDLLFSELMLWGWLRRLWLERRIRNTLALLEGVHARADLAHERRAELLLGLANALEAGDPYTSGHSRRVARHAEKIARRLGLPAQDIAKVRTAAALHDVGKLDTPRQILHKRGQLSDAEFAVIKQHPRRGGELAAQLGDPELSAIIRHHHERIDGTGYPDGLAGDAIPFAARIIAVADTFDAIISTRPYRPGASHRTAIAVLTAEAGTQLDPAAVRAFTSVYSGRRSLSLWMVFTTAPERLASWFGSGINTAAATAARVMTTAAVTTAAAATAVVASTPSSSAPALTDNPAALLASAGSAGSAPGQLTSTPPPTSVNLLPGGSTAGALATRQPAGSHAVAQSSLVFPLTASPGGSGHPSPVPTPVLTVPVAAGAGTQIAVSPPGGPVAPTPIPTPTTTQPGTTFIQRPSTTPSSGGGDTSGGGHGATSAGGTASGSSGSSGSGTSSSHGTAGSGNGNAKGSGNGSAGGTGTGNSTHASSGGGSGSGSGSGSGNTNGGQGGGSQSSSSGSTTGGGSNAGGSGSSNAGSGSSNAGSGSSSTAGGSGNAGAHGSGNASSNAAVTGNTGGNGKGH